MTGTPLHKVVSGLNRWLEQGVSKEAEVVYVPSAFGLPGGLCVTTDKDVAQIDIEVPPKHGDITMPHIVKPGTAKCEECGKTTSQFDGGEFYRVPMGSVAVLFAVVPGGGSMPIADPPD